jgi:hypothetical protein
MDIQELDLTNPHERLAQLLAERRGLPTDSPYLVKLDAELAVVKAMIAACLGIHNSDGL